jgi:hypothetical protein
MQKVYKQDDVIDQINSRMTAFDVNKAIGVKQKSSQ